MPSALPNPSGTPNIFLLAADASPQLLPALRADPSLLTSQDPTGYSLVHALASYNHLSLLRSIDSEFPGQLQPNLTDSDGETALFTVETVAAAQYLVEELVTDWKIKNHEGVTAEEFIRGEGECVTVADYLGTVRTQAAGGGAEGEVANGSAAVNEPRLPDGVKMEVGAIGEEEAAELPEPDPEFKRRIEELAARDDFQSAEGQAALRDLVQDAVREVGDGERDVRRRLE